MTKISTIFVLVILSCLSIISLAQNFNNFGSYKDAKVKPRNYGKVLKRRHPVTEYLSENQIEMLMRRKAPTTADHSFDNNWSGFNEYKKVVKNRKNNLRRNRIGSNPEGPDNSSGEISGTTASSGDTVTERRRLRTTR
jgi:hypothetical protein